MVLSLDIGGGVVSNFTGGTVAYYRAEARSPHAFVWVHGLQGAVLAWIYGEWWGEVAVLAALAMGFASLVIRLQRTGFRRQLGVLLFTLLSLAAVAVPGLPRLGLLLLLLLGLKLILGFAGNRTHPVLEA
ncbi:hypothetical protein I0P70_12575 [Pontibacter sp. FD36]|uniref:hypothetical protein n=1 Tax=Pontibacter sp. FD36 TaxID=2789860 RepID=UPI0018AA2B37|nr:hypothetical protein [Pontibacter sp. FD36]MBF8964083.1 hypothetical protein [Pontibacter sp. FD36]